MFNAFVFGGGMKKHVPATQWRTIRPGKARGELTGGYLDNYVYLALSGWIQPEAGEGIRAVLRGSRKVLRR